MVPTLCDLKIQECTAAFLDLHLKYHHHLVVMRCVFWMFATVVYSIVAGHSQGSILYISNRERGRDIFPEGRRGRGREGRRGKGKVKGKGKGR